VIDLKNPKLCRERLIPDLEKLFRETIAVTTRIRMDSGFDVQVHLEELRQELNGIIEQAKQIEA